MRLYHSAADVLDRQPEHDWTAHRAIETSHVLSSISHAHCLITSTHTSLVKNHPSFLDLL